MTSASVASVLDELRRYRLLEPGQIEQITPPFSDPKALVGELLRRKWLTPYQATCLLQGRAQELLLGSYVLLERLGEGGMGQVFKVRNWKLGRVVALKLIRAERLSNPDAVRRFRREIQAAAALSHPNIVAASDADEVGGAHFLVMEYVEGGVDLARLVKEKGLPLPAALACECVRQAALGLQHAFERGMVHRDVKPANLLLTAHGRTVKLLDLGLARLDQGEAGENSSTVTQEGAVMGTPDYIAPEQALESHSVDIRADLYSLGCTLYFLLTGRPPFPGGTLLQKLDKHRYAAGRPLSGYLRPDVPRAVGEVTARLMAKRPEDRYQTPAEAASALALAVSANRTGTEARRWPVAPQDSADTLASPFDFQATSTSEDSPRAPGKQVDDTRRLLLLVAGGSVLLLASAALVFRFLGSAQEKEPPAARKPTPPVEKPPAGGKVDDAWLAHVEALRAHEQVEAAAAKLKELNPDFDGLLTPRIDGDAVIGLELRTDKVADLSPLRGLPALQSLACSAKGRGPLKDLSPLKGMRLTSLEFGGTSVSDLSPLVGMPLNTLIFHDTPVADLSLLAGMKLVVLRFWASRVTDLAPLAGMPLRDLSCASTRVSDLSPLAGMKTLVNLGCNESRVADLSPLAGMKLTYLDVSGTKVADLKTLAGMPLITLWFNGTKVSDLSPLKGMKLNRLGFTAAPVADLSPLRGMPLRVLWGDRTKVTDLSPLVAMPLRELHCTFDPERDAGVLRSIPTLAIINGTPAREFWKGSKVKN